MYVDIKRKILKIETKSMQILINCYWYDCTLYYNIDYK